MQSGLDSLSFGRLMRGALVAFAFGTSPMVAVADVFAETFSNQTRYDFARNTVERQSFESLAVAVRDQDVLGFLDMVEPSYFTGQMAFLLEMSSVDRPAPVGETLSQFLCEFLSACTVGRKLGFEDILSLEYLSVEEFLELGEPPILIVRARLVFNNETTGEAEFLYFPNDYRFSAAAG